VSHPDSFGLTVDRTALIALVCDVPRFFARARAADRDDTRFLIAVSEKRRPCLLADAADDLKLLFVLRLVGGRLLGSNSNRLKYRN
jgi:hypothetical protein